LVRPTRVRRLRIRRVTQVAILVVGALLVSSVFAFAARKNVTLVVDGRPVAVRTTSASVQELLDAAGLPAGVRAEPPPATALADGMTVVVSPPPGVPAEALTHMVDPHEVGVWVVERTDEGSFGKAAPTSGEATVSADVVGQSQIVSVEAVVSGKVHDVISNASTVGALLSAMGIQPDADDRVAPPPSTPLHDGDSIRYDDVSVAVEDVTTPVPFDVVTTYTPDMVPGHSRVVAPGVSGLRAETVRVTTVNGTVESREILASSPILPPWSQRVISGPMSMTEGTLTEPGTGATSQQGQATWYDPPWSGLTAAHPWLPFGTLVSVTDVATGRSVTVVVDDRGPFAPGRIIDLSPEAFEQLAPLGRGVLHVRLSW